ncbi:50S ribosomal protein L32, partial [Rickettsiales bacterium]|nr:50S ribosomal protein L32 [Rickettsiales bacterium]
HDSLKVSNLSECPNCGELKLSHQICLSCGYYAKKEIIKIDSEVETEGEE